MADKHLVVPAKDYSRWQEAVTLSNEVHIGDIGNLVLRPLLQTGDDPNKTMYGLSEDVPVSLSADGQQVTNHHVRWLSWQVDELRQVEEPDAERPITTDEYFFGDWRRIKID